MDNQQKLRDLLMDVLLLSEQEFSLDLQREQIETWDSLAIVALAAGIDETFGYHLSQDEAVSLTGVRDIVKILQREGTSFAEA